MGYAFFVLIAIFALLMIPFSASAAQGAAEGMRVFSQDMLPVLFPFMVCAGCVTNSPLFPRISSLPRPLSGFAAAVSCALFGTPSSAMFFGRLSELGLIDTRRSSFLCGLLNLSGPLFIISVLSERFFGLRAAALSFAAAHYLPPLLIALPLCSFGSNGTAALSRRSAPAVFTEAVSASVINSLRVGGTVVFFFVVHAVLYETAALTRIPEIIPDSLSAVLEMTGGLSIFSGELTRASAMICSAILSFGGLCLFLQAKLVFPKLRAGWYFAAKLASATLSAAMMYCIYPLLFQSLAVFSFEGDSLGAIDANAVPKALSLLGFLGSASAAIVIALIISCAFDKKRGAAFRQPRER